MDCDITGLNAVNTVRIKNLNAKISLLERDREELNAKVGQYRDKLRESHYDGSNLDRVSLTTMFYKLKGSKQENVKDRAELLAVWLKYSQAIKDQADAGVLFSKLEDERMRLLGEKEKSQLESLQSGRDGALSIEENLEQIQYRLGELQKAVVAGREASVCLDTVEEDLLKVEELGEASGGMLSSAVIFEHVHAARAQAGLAQRLMYSFRYALAGENWCETDNLTGFADCFLDCLVLDFIPRGLVHQSLACVRDAQNILSLIKAGLDTIIETQREEMCMLRIKKAETKAV